MPTFVDNQQIAHLQTAPNALEYVTLTGYVSRSGNTVTLSSLNCHVEITYATSVYGEHNEFYITNSQTSTTKLSTTGYQEYNYTISYDQRPKKYDFSMPDMSFSVATTDTSKTLWLRCTSNEDHQYSFTVTFPSGASAPTGLSLDSYTAGRDSFTGTVSVTGWGGVGDASSRYREFQVWTYTSSGLSEPRRWAVSRGNTLSGSITVNNSSSTSETALTITPNTRYVLGVYATNGTYNTGSVRKTDAYTLPPVPSVSRTGLTSSSATFSYSIPNQGGGKNMTLQYSLNGGSTWSNAVTLSGSGTKSGSFTVSGLSAYTDYTMQTRLTTDVGSSSGNTLSFKTSAVAPATPVISNVQPQQYGIKATVTIANYGSPNNDPERYIELEGGISGGSTLLWRYTLSKAVTTATLEVNNDSGGTIPIFEPNSNYSYRGMATNGQLTTRSAWVDFTCLPPTPTGAVLTITGTTTATLDITCPPMGYGSTVTAYYKLNNGSWLSAGEITTGATITKNLTGLTAGTAYTPTVKFTNVSGDSPSITGTAATTWKAPATPVVSNVSPGKDSLTATVTIANYGVPSDDADRHIELEVSTVNGGTSYRYANQTAVLTKTFTVDNNSSATSGAPTLTPNTKYSYRGVARNTKVNVGSSWVQFITKPDAPTATATAVNPFGATFRISAPAQGTAATLTAYYKVGSGSWVSAGTITQGGYVDVNLSSLTPETTYAITTKITNSTGDSATSSLSITTPGAYKFYGSVNELTERTIKMYGSVNGSSKEVVKLYGSTNGVTKRIF